MEKNIIHPAVSRFIEKKIIAIVRGLPVQYVEPLCEALLRGGINMMEFTFDHLLPETDDDTTYAIECVTKRFSGEMMAGAGTVLTLENLYKAHNAGAQFIISPSTNTEIIHATKACKLASFPGAMTATEVSAAYVAGADAVKLFPASQLGPSYIKALRAPLAHIPMFAVGGITEENTGDFIRAGAIGVGTGGNLVRRDWIEAGAFDRIEAAAKAYCKALFS